VKDALGVDLDDAGIRSGHFVYFAVQLRILDTASGQTLGGMTPSEKLAEVLQ
jgi:hypothetical protein